MDSHSHTCSTQVLPDLPSRRDLAPPGPGFASRRIEKTEHASGKEQSTPEVKPPFPHAIGAGTSGTAYLESTGRATGRG